MSINAQLAQGSKLYIAGSASAPVTITGVAVGYPTILTLSGHGLANGDYCAIAGLTGTDAALLNGKSLPVGNHVTGAANDTVAVPIDTTAKTITAGSGTITPTAWVQINEIKGIKPGGASASKIDVTDLNSTAKEYRTGLIDNGTLACDVHILESDPGQTAALASFTSSAVSTFKHVAPAKTRTFNGSFLKFPTVPDGSVDGVQTGSMEIQISSTVALS